MFMEWSQRSLKEVKASREYPKRHSKRKWRKHLSIRRNTVLMGISILSKSRLKIVTSGDISTTLLVPKHKTIFE